VHFYHDADCLHQAQMLVWENKLPITNKTKTQQEVKAANHHNNKILVLSSLKYGKLTHILRL